MNYYLGFHRNLNINKDLRRATLDVEKKRNTVFNLKIAMAFDAFHSLSFTSFVIVVVLVLNCVNDCQINI